MSHGRAWHPSGSASADFAAGSAGGDCAAGSDEPQYTEYRRVRAATDGRFATDVAETLGELLAAHEEHVESSLGRHAQQLHDRVQEMLGVHQTGLVEAVKEVLLQQLRGLECSAQNHERSGAAPQIQLRPGAAGASDSTRLRRHAGQSNPQDRGSSPGGQSQLLAPPLGTPRLPKPSNGEQATAVTQFEIPYTLPLEVLSRRDSDVCSDEFVDHFPLPPREPGATSSASLAKTVQFLTPRPSPRESEYHAEFLQYAGSSHQLDAQLQPHLQERPFHPQERPFHLQDHHDRDSLLSVPALMGPSATMKHVNSRKSGGLIRKTAVAHIPKKPRSRPSRMDAMRRLISDGKKRKHLRNWLNPRVLCRHVFRIQFVMSIVTSRAFELAVSGLIMFNAIVIGVQTDYAVKNLGEDNPPEFRMLDVFFAAGFTLELLLRLVAEQWFFVSCANPNIRWNVFDSSLVLSAMVEEIFSAMDTANLDMSAMRVLRIMRLVRVLRIIRVMRTFSDLRKMVMGILSSLKSLMWCLLLLMIIMFTIGVCLMQICTEELVRWNEGGATDVAVKLTDEDADLILEYYGGLIRTVYTLYMSICGGLDWSGAADPLMAVHPVLGVLFSVYIAFAVFCVLNIVTGVFVENANKITQQCDDNAIIDELAIRELWEEEVQYLFKSADTDGSGELDWEEFEACLQDQRIINFFNKLHISLEPDSVHALFQLLDFSGDGTVDMDEFVEGCTHVHGNARSLDVARLRHDNRTISHQISSLTHAVARLAGHHRHEIESSASATITGFSKSSKPPKPVGLSELAKPITNPISDNLAFKEGSLKEYSEGVPKPGAGSYAMASMMCGAGSFAMMRPDSMQKQMSFTGQPPMEQQPLSNAAPAFSHGVAQQNSSPWTPPQPPVLPPDFRPRPPSGDQNYLPKPQTPESPQSRRESEMTLPGAYDDGTDDESV